MELPVHTLSEDLLLTAVEPYGDPAALPYPPASPRWGDNHMGRRGTPHFVAVHAVAHAAPALVRPVGRRSADGASPRWQIFRSRW